MSIKSKVRLLRHAGWHFLCGAESGYAKLEVFRSIRKYNTCLHQGVFPKLWKRQRLEVQSRKCESLPKQCSRVVDRLHSLDVPDDLITIPSYFKNGTFIYGTDQCSSISLQEHHVRCGIPRTKAWSCKNCGVRRRHCDSSVVAAKNRRDCPKNQNNNIWGEKIATTYNLGNTKQR